MDRVLKLEDVNLFISVHDTLAVNKLRIKEDLKLNCGLQESDLMDFDNFIDYTMGYRDVDVRIRQGEKVGNNDLLKIFSQMIGLKIRKNMPVFVFGNLSEIVIKELVYGVAKECGRKVKCFFVQEDFIKTLSTKDKDLVIGTKQMLNYLEFQKSFYEKLNVSGVNQIIGEGDLIQLSINPIMNTNLDIVGDVHGNYDKLMEHLGSLGWTYTDETGFSHADRTRQILFLGDVVDRHDDSVKILLAIMNAVKKKNTLFLMGNHENKLLNSLDIFIRSGQVVSTAPAPRATLMSAIKEGRNKILEIISFLKKAKKSYTVFVDKDSLKVLNGPTDNSVSIALTHANLANFNPLTITSDNAMYGERNLPKSSNPWVAYEQGYKSGKNDFLLIHGHVENLDDIVCDASYSLDYNQAYNGYMASMNLGEFLLKLKENNFEPSYKLFKESTVLTKTNYMYDKLRDVSLHIEAINSSKKNKI